MRPLVWVQYDYCPFNKRKFECKYTHRGRHVEKAATYKPRRAVSEETNHAIILILDLASRAVRKINLCLSYSVCGILLWQPK